MKRTDDVKENSEMVSTYRLTHDEMLVIGTAVSWATIADGSAASLGLRRAAEDALIAAVRAWQKANMAHFPLVTKKQAAKTKKRRVRRTP